MGLSLAAPCLVGARVGGSWKPPHPAVPPPRIKHPNIVALDDIYESSTHLYLIMQL